VTEAIRDHLAVVGCILDSGGFAAILAGLEPAGLLYLGHSAGKSPCDALHKSGCPMTVHHNGMGLGLRQNTSARPATPSAATAKPSFRKIKFKLNRWIANSLTDTNQ
jgi:hypothetical protein